MKTGTAGSTLVELLVVLAILGIIVGITGLSFRGEVHRASPNLVESRVSNARREALRSGHSVTVTVMQGELVAVATAHPDGRVVADSGIAIDLLTGRPTR
jgi:prepilin-type N-terminal cleavage/methylation domain-containing protein